MIVIFIRDTRCSEAKTNFLACILEDVEPETNRKWGTRFRDQLFACLKLHVPIEKYELDAFKAINVEHKYFLPMERDYFPGGSTGRRCVFLTLGIGNSTKSEKEFLHLYPDKCRLYGVELVPNNEDDFATIGTVIHAGVSLSLNEPGKPDWPRSPSVLANYTDYAGHTYYNLSMRAFPEVSYRQQFTPSDRRCSEGYMFRYWTMM